jgi:soluble lytic murein transglycosylase
MSGTAGISRRSSAQRTAAVRRRRAIAIVLVIGAVVALAWPMLHKAVRDLTLPLAYSGIIREQAAEKHLDPALIAAVIFAETKFDGRTSPTGALGLMQIEPATAAFLAHRSGATSFTVADLSTPAVNIAYGSYYLRYLLDRYGGDRTLALAAYNGGEANVDSWLAAAHSAGHSFTLSDIPFPETRAYVTKVEDAEVAYRHNWGSALGE